ncbi:MAG: helix-turn-helix domain-containing protein [Nitrospirae bacterium]|nr:MAG: helix-turn-helix domain-containing protein [Nitrospirota bacterium]
MNKELLRVNEAAEVLNVSRWTIYRWVDEGRLKATKIGKGSVRLFRQSVDAIVHVKRKDQWGIEIHNSS